jgi:hypothetical protein
MPRNLFAALASILSVVLALAFFAGCSSPSDPPPYQPSATIGACAYMPAPSDCSYLASLADPNLPGSKQIYQYNCPDPNDPGAPMITAVNLHECADEGPSVGAGIFCCSY